MSKACFGVEQLFAKELRRRSRLDRPNPNNHHPHPNQHTNKNRVLTIDGNGMGVGGGGVGGEGMYDEEEAISDLTNDSDSPQPHSGGAALLSSPSMKKPLNAMSLLLGSMGATGNGLLS